MPAVTDGDRAGCGCGLTVVRWTGRESRALREALRMSVRAFAEHLGVTSSTVSSWENKTTALPLRLATQSVLDRALKLADTDAKTRFAVLVASLTDGPSGAVTGDGGSVAGRPVVTAFRRPEMARSAS
ncbi:helix-turn-helix domain-containing protein [Verrucosispora sp. TAA-831]|uniref:helix-turn-helix domain-containing protein n=1 Tax=Verrucosispora sp. TAA-831 TaxID=3422227 RepID=UPI003D6EAEB0